MNHKHDQRLSYLLFICANTAAIVCIFYPTNTINAISFKSQINSYLPGSSVTKKFITDKLGITSIQVNKVIMPTSVEELQRIVHNAQYPIAIVGRSYSQGGQTAYPNSIVIDMRKLNKIINFNSEEKTITIQAGANWRKVQQYIDPYSLSIKAMQSYNDFSVGGALSVNAHGRDIAYGSVINGIQSIRIIIADGTLVSADRNTNSDLFKAAIGGYGLLGIITDVTIELTDNIALERKIRPCTISNFNTVFNNDISSDPSVVLYNTDIFPNEYTKCLVTTWHKTNKPVTDPKRLQPKNSIFYMINRGLELFIKRIPFAKYSRLPFEQLKQEKPSVVWRNNEMSYSVNQLTIQNHFPTTMTLQEYFIPVKYAQVFAKQLCAILKKNWVNVLNISIRHVKPDTTATMSYAHQECFAFVLYFNIFNFKKSIDSTCRWTQKVINKALSYGGTYYLPYIQCATKKQFDKAYPQFKTLLEVKKIYDPKNKFRNMLFQKYGESF